MNVREVWSAVQVADHLGLATAASARRTLSRWGIEAVEYRRNESGRPEAAYSAAQVREAQAARPGQGARTDLERLT